MPSQWILLSACASVAAGTRIVRSSEQSWNRASYNTNCPAGQELSETDCSQRAASYNLLFEGVVNDSDVPAGCFMQVRGDQGGQNFYSSGNLFYNENKDGKVRLRGNVSQPLGGYHPVYLAQCDHATGSTFRGFVWQAHNVTVIPGANSCPPGKELTSWECSLGLQKMSVFNSLGVPGSYKGSMSGTMTLFTRRGKLLNISGGVSPFGRVGGTVISTMCLASLTNSSTLHALTVEVVDLPFDWPIASEEKLSATSFVEEAVKEDEALAGMPQTHQFSDLFDSLKVGSEAKLSTTNLAEETVQAVRTAFAGMTNAVCKV